MLHSKILLKDAKKIVVNWWKDRRSHQAVGRTYLDNLTVVWRIIASRVHDFNISENLGY